MKFIAIEQEIPGKTTADFAPHLAAEAVRAWELYKQGVFRELYFHADDHGAVVITEQPAVGASWFDSF